MAIVSFAQNFEDVLLWRALQHVGQGFYIDVGAQDPVIDSVSKAFYDHGWRGIHVEPTPQYADLLRQARPDEAVIQAAVSDESGTASFFVIPDTGHSTVSRETAEEAAQLGYELVETTVATVTLDQVLEQAGSREVHWLKIDVEGFEHAVLKGWRKSLCRPWLVVVEATKPLTQVEAHKDWHRLLSAKSYELAYSDGLNRYYLSSAHKDLKRHFRHGPSVWDQYQLPVGSYHTLAIDKHYAEQLSQVRSEVESGAAELDRLREILEQTMAQLEVTRVTADESSKQHARSNVEAANSQHDLLEARDTIGQLEIQLVSLRDELRDAGVRMAELTGELSLVRQASKETQDLLSCTESLLSESRGDLEKARAMANRAATERDVARKELQIAMEDLERDRVIIELMAEELRQSADRWSAQNGRLRRQLASIRNSLWWRIANLMKPPRWLATNRSDKGMEVRRPAEASADAVRPAVSVEELLALRDEAFVRCAFASIAGSEPDARSFDHYLGRIRSGCSRRAVLADIYFSLEMSAGVPMLPGLAHLIRQERLLRVPLLGTALRLCGFGGPRIDVEQRLAIMENHLELLTNVVHTSAFSKAIQSLQTSGTEGASPMPTAVEGRQESESSNKNSRSVRQRPIRGAFINTANANCSIFESGRMIFSCIKQSADYTLDYFSLDMLDLPYFLSEGKLRPAYGASDGEALASLPRDYDFWVFNWHFNTMGPFLD